ncbi:PfkB family carbohydrate kinase [uncultured Demequina sp.]|uniref:PfkB family carbohydrate kinase n=1 Tax=uncultured Demequina sp. TaxID=693499 RepID=UPI0025D46B15|nr:PfkB family carbohydrate kinase [uncultured Demequina sp.]
MPPEPPRALFAGLTTLDVIHSVDRLPAPNQKVVALEHTVAAGGPATNAAVAFAHLGGSPTLATRLPDHALTTVIVDDLAATGVALHDVGGADGPPVTASILVTRGTGERAVISPTASAVATPTGTPDLPPLEGTRAVLVDGYHPDVAIPLARAARASAVPVIMDAGSLKPHSADVARECDLVIASADLTSPDGSGDPGDVFAWLESLGVASAAITRGGGSILWRSGRSDGEVAVPRTDVVDTLGAGDFFHGAVAFRIASLGWDPARLAEDLAWAADAVAPSLRSFGTRAWLGEVSAQER